MRELYKSLDKEELEANLFASHLLIPEDLLRSEMIKLWPNRAMPVFSSTLKEDSLVKLSNVFKVSPTLMAVRMSELGLLKI